MLSEILGKDETYISKRLRLLEKAGLVRGEWRRIGNKNVRLYFLNADKIQIKFDFDGCKVLLETEGKEKIVVITSLYDFRIPSPEDFVGRTKELKMLTSKKNFFIIEGMAGIGKTSLVSKFVEGIKENHHIFWHSLKEVDSFNFLMNKLALFLSKFHHFELLNYLKSGGSDDAVKMSLLLQEIDSEEYVVIFDDYQRCRDERIDILLEYLQKNLRKAKVIVLSRVRPRFFSPLNENVIEKKLSGLNINETMEFLSKKGIRVNPSKVEEIQKRLSGHPLALNMFCKAVNGRNLTEILRDLPEHGLLEYFWNEIYQGLEDRERILLQTLSIFRYPVPAQAIINVSRIRGIRSILYSLERKMIVERFNGKYFLHEIIRDLCYRLIDNPKEMHRLAAKYYLSEENTESLLEAIYHMIKAEDFQRAAQTIRNDLESEEYSCIKKGYFSQYLNLLKNILNKDIDKETWCWIVYGKGRAHLARGEFSEAIKSFSEVLVIVNELPRNILLIYKTLRNLGKAYIGSGNLQMAEKYFIRSLSLIKEVSDLSSLGGIFFEAAMLYLYKGDLDEMKRLLDVGLSVCKKIGSERNEAIGHYYYAGLHEMRNNWKEAVECCERSLEIFEKIGDVLWIAILHAELAFIKTFLRKFDEALKHFDMGIKIFERTHIYNKLVEAYSDRALLYIAMKNLEEAEKDCEKAIELKSITGELPYHGVTYRALGMIATAREDWIKAESYFRQSVKMLSTIHKFHLAETYLEFASMYEHKGDIKNAIECINRSLEIFRKLGSKEKINRAQKRIKRITLDYSAY